MQPVLLKRGPVLVGGEEERELMIFTNGFILSRVEMDTLVNLLLGDDVVSAPEDCNDAEEFTSRRLSQRFNIIDSDGSGCKFLQCMRCLLLFPHT